jgi:hypothetical protein
MGRIFGLHRIELRPGVDAAEFERFATRSLAETPTLPGWRFALLKGDRGEQEGKYLVLAEVESIEARDRASPAGGLTEEGEQWFATATPLLEQWREYTTQAPGLETPFTDFHEITP